MLTCRLLLLSEFCLRWCGICLNTVLLMFMRRYCQDTVVLRLSTLLLSMVTRRRVLLPSSWIMILILVRLSIRRNMLLMLMLILNRCIMTWLFLVLRWCCRLLTILLNMVRRFLPWISLQLNWRRNIYMLTRLIRRIVRLTGRSRLRRYMISCVDSMTVVPGLQLPMVIMSR